METAATAPGTATPAGTCLKCGHTRKPTEPGPAYACPACGAVYAKVEAARRQALEMTEKKSIQRPPPRRNDVVDDDARDRDLSKMANWTYVLFLISIALPFVGVIMAYVMRKRASGSYVESHFSWLIATFWRALALTFLAGVLYVVLVVLSFKTRNELLLLGVLGAGFMFGGASLLIAAWYYYRVVRGWYRLKNAEPT